MSLYFHSLHGLLLFLLSTLGIANIFPRRDGFETHIHGTAMLARDDELGFQDPACFTYCDLDTCGSDSAPSCSYSAINKRSLPDDGITPAFIQHNTSDYIKKRVWRGIDTSGATIRTAEVAAYLSGQINIAANYDDQYGARLPVYDEEGNNGHGTELTMSQQWQFTQGNVQIGTGGLHGCTMLTVVSSRAIYMAHYWESYTTGRVDSGKGQRDPRVLDQNGNPIRLRNGKWRRERVVTDDTDWYEKVLNTISGEGHYEMRGEPIQKELFNKKTDQTKIYIMAPTKNGLSEDTYGKYSVKANDVAGGKEVRDSLKYPRKIGMMVDLLGSLFPNAEIKVLAYVPLNYDNGAQAEQGQGNTGYRGIALFQYDTEGIILRTRRAGTKGDWRLFYQDKLIMGSVGEFQADGKQT